MHSLIFSIESVGAMLVESYRSIQNRETGGILTGPRKQKGIITDAIPSSEYAKRNLSTYLQTAKDVEILNSRLKEFHSIGYDFKGYFHKHPSGFYGLSGGDMESCAEILRSPNYKIDNFLVMCIITATSHQYSPIFSYILSLAENGIVIVKNAVVKIMPKRCIQEYLECFEEDDYEDSSPRHCDKSLKKRGECNTIRPQGKGHYNINLYKPRARARKNRIISKGEKTPDKHLQKGSVHLLPEKC